jgi:hypothetical protein
VIGPDLARELSGEDAEPGAAFRGIAYGCAVELAAGLVLLAVVALLLRVIH